MLLILRYSLQYQPKYELSYSLNLLGSLYAVPPHTGFRIFVAVAVVGKVKLQYLHTEKCAVVLPSFILDSICRSSEVIA